MILDFLKTAVNLKNIPRQGWIDKINIANPESVADHTFSMAIIGMLISDIENYNSEKILKMVLLHDLAESKVGDITPGQMSSEKKKELENNAFDKIISNLPEKIKNQYFQAWKEYQNNFTKEANLVHQIDKLEMALQAKSYEHKGHPKEKLESFYTTASLEISNQSLKELFTKIINED
ncbi:MAG: HD domain-containing protein [Nitrosopumilus sp.]|nr:HD domain-containing protein [Nitrosopumilus sp.]